MQEFKVTLIRPKRQPFVLILQAENSVTAAEEAVLRMGNDWYISDIQNYRKEEKNGSPVKSM